jgi:predicted N-formylglutamate amidohydrolase
LKEGAEKSGGRSAPPGTTDLRILITCEHAGNRVPDRWAPLFESRDDLLASHRGWDPGALPLARQLARLTRAPLRYSTTTRLLVDPNRSPGHGTLFSELTQELPEEERRRIVSRHHRPYWTRVRSLLTGWLAEGALALHVGVHTFTPTLDGIPRAVDVGVLFDPDRPGEVVFSRIFMEELERALPHLRVKENAPYYGTSDGLTTSLRRMLDDPGYLGIELEVSQGLAAAPEPERSRVNRGIGEALTRTLSRWP